MLFLFLLFLILLGLGTFIFLQYRKHNRANELYYQARQLERKDTNNPYDSSKIHQALVLYKQCCELVNSSLHIQAVNQCQKKINDREKFKSFLAVARNNIKYKFFKEALNELRKAKQLFTTPDLESEIVRCQENIQYQEKYENLLEESVEIARQGNFKAAIDLLQPALNEFDRNDGQQLLKKLERVIKAKELYYFGLASEKYNKVNNAINKYQEALKILPEFTECKIRLGIINSNNNPNRAISYLKNIEGKQAAYIRGFAHAQLGNWQEASQEWNSINNSVVREQNKIIKTLAKRDRLFKIKEIESQVDNNNLEIAKALSLEFIEQFDSEFTVKHNLENYIQPLLERQIWDTQDWQTIATKTEQIWLEQQDINSLHNWAIATYYQAQIDSSKLANFIIAWSTALANIEQNSTVKDVSWLGSKSIDIKDVSAKLKQILENAIDVVKDENIEKYLILRDIYRRDMVTLSLIQQNNCGMRIKKQLLILPGCYQRFCSHFPGIRFPGSVWGALYTDWGKAVAACHEGDTARAINIKPSKNPTSDVDDFAYCFVSYHEGCYYLQNLEWRKAIQPLQQAKPEIKANSEWCKEIDRLCELQRHKIKNFDEHLEFSQCWYELINSQPAQSYYAEQKAIQIAQKLDDKKISFQQSLNELKELQKIDPDNSLILDLIEKVEFNLELEKINRLWQNGKYEEAIKFARRSRNEKIRFRMAECCINVILEIAGSSNPNFDIMLQLAKWAYELCPHEPAFKPIYSKLGIY